MRFEEFKERIDTQKATVAVVGLGYVGLPVAKAFERAGFDVIGYDNDRSKAEAIAQEHGLHATADSDYMMRADVFIVCVPTPIRGIEPDLAHVQDVAAKLPTDKLVILESTVAPGDTERCFAETQWLAFSPEREDPGTGRDLTKIPKLVAGRSSQSATLAVALYKQVFENLIEVETIRIAEMAKLIENTYRAVNIALANEFKAAGDALDIDVWAAIDAAKTKPFGFQAFYPGPGVGGHCIPVDPYYLTHAVQGKAPLTLIPHAMLANQYAPQRLGYRILAKLGVGSAAKILIVGLTYKKNIDDVRNSPSVALLDFLRGFGVHVAWYDEHANWVPPRSMRLMRISKPVLESFQAIVLMADHDDFDYSVLDEHPCVFDTRGRLPKRSGVHRV